MEVVRAVQKYISTAPPIFALNAIVGVDYLKEETGCYSIESVPCDPIVTYYLDGSSVRRYQFVFAGKEIWDDDVILNIENIGFYDALVDWFEENTRKGILPDLGDDREAMSIRTLSSPMLMTENGEKARYQITCELEYLQRRT